MKNISLLEGKRNLLDMDLLIIPALSKKLDLIASKQLTNTCITTAKSIKLHKRIMSFEKNTICPIEKNAKQMQKSDLGIEDDCVIYILLVNV